MLYTSYFVLFAHFLLLSILCLFGLHRLSMVYRWFKYRNVHSAVPQTFASYPRVTIQIPLFNERLVVERIIHAAAQIEYPKNKLQIQIVDDSTDETRTLAGALVSEYARQGLDIQHLHRTNRKGFKAGALKEAMVSATGEFIAIFDSDFVPQPHVIRDNIHEFTNERVAVVQFRWEHLNANDSQLTESQAIMLDSHFALEQQVRSATNALFNFNGTAGMWRTQAILDSGNWSADTLTEDLDLSYRAQLKGWRLVYLNDQGCPGELPADMNAFKSQQHRWAKGGIQVMKKMLGRVWKSNLPVRHKIEGTFHLSNNLAYFVMLFDTTFFLVPSLIVRDWLQIEAIFWLDLPLLVLASGGHLVYFFYGQVALGKSKWHAIKTMPRILLLGIQLAFNNAKAATEALLDQQSEFVRTPKVGAAGVVSAEGHLERASSRNQGKILGAYRAISPKGGAFELLLGSIYAFVLVWSVGNDQWYVLPFLLLLVVGFFSTAIVTLKNQYAPSR